MSQRRPHWDDPQECICRWVRDEDGLPECADSAACYCTCHDEEEVPTPGSPEAVAQGCTCPVMDNGHGAGRGGLFWTSGDCPLHGGDNG